jgi:predicted O-methyltransferase YrrM
MNKQELLKRIEMTQNNIYNVSLVNDSNKYGIVESYKKNFGWGENWMVTSKYFRALASYVQCFDSKNILELGTQTGASAVALSKYGAKVDTYDISDKNLASGILNHPDISFKKLVTPDEFLSFDLKKYDLIFFDIDHSGFLEEKFHQKLVNEYQGICFYDDIFFNTNMKFFWNGIQQTKIELDWHVAGFGMVSYGG